MAGLKDQVVLLSQQPMTQPLSWVLVVMFILFQAGAALRATREGASYATLVIFGLAAVGEVYLLNWGSTHAISLSLPGMPR